MRRTRFAIALGVPGLAVLAALGTTPQPGLAETSERLPAPHATSSTSPTSVPVPAVAAGSMAQPVVVPRSVTAATRGIDAAFAASGVTPGRATLLDVPAVVASAYGTAAASAPASCHVGVPLLAAIGQVESGNLAGHRLDARHRAVPAVVGPRLDGHAFAAVRDTDNGALDGDRKWDRAVGPMQFLPSTWRTVGVDMDRDGVRDPQDIDDAAGAAMVYLCSGGRDLSTPAGVRSAVLSYNHSEDYLAQVLAWRDLFASSTTGSAGGFGSWAVPGATRPATAPARPGGPTRPLKVPTKAVKGPASGPVPHAPATGTTGTTTRPSTPGSTPAAGTPAPAGTTAGGTPTTTPTTTPTAGGKPGADGGTTPSTGPGHEPSGTPTSTPTSTPGPTPGPTSTPTSTPTPTPTPTRPVDTTTATGPLPSCPVPSPTDPTVLLDVMTGLPAVVDLTQAVPVTATTTPVPTVTDLDHPTACTPVIDPATGLPATHPLTPAG